MGVLKRQETYTDTLQSAATADGNGEKVFTNGLNTQLIAVQKTGGGTTTVVIEGSFDGGTTWYAVGYQQIDGTASPTRAVIAIVVGAGAVNHVYQVLDHYPLLRARLASTSGAIAATVLYYGVPV